LRIVKVLDAGIYLAFAVYLLTRWNWSYRYLIGMGIAALCFALWMVARHQLGASFSVTAQARQLVTTGIYSKIRHPIYFFVGVGYLGLFLALGYWIPAIWFAVVYSTQFLRIFKEESVLEEAFGEEYRHYKAQTWF